MNNTEKLLPCPFCGGEAELAHSNDNKHRPYIRCKFGAFKNPPCPCSFPYQWSYKEIKGAVEAWNKRI